MYVCETYIYVCESNVNDVWKRPSFANDLWNIKMTCDSSRCVTRDLHICMWDLHICVWDLHICMWDLHICVRVQCKWRMKETLICKWHMTYKSDVTHVKRDLHTCMWDQCKRLVQETLLPWLSCAPQRQFDLPCQKTPICVHNRLVCV